MPNIKLQSSDGEVFVVDIQIAKCINTVKDLLEALDMKEYGREVIPLPNVNAFILRKILEWATYHRNDPVPVPKPEPEREEKKSRVRSTVVGQWDRVFLDVDQGTLFELILAANYLDIPGLQEVACKTVANMIKGKSPEDIRKTFNIAKDLTLEEEQKIRAENELIEDMDDD